MAIVPADFISTAQRLTTGSEESDYRSAISRAYYSTYHYCDALKNHLPQRTVSGSSGVHEILVARFEQCDKGYEYSSEARKIGYLLAQLRTARVKADYRLKDTIRKKLAESNILTAQRLIKLTDELDSMIKKGTKSASNS